jgi:hypothetical protein
MVGFSSIVRSGPLGRPLRCAMCSANEECVLGGACGQKALTKVASNRHTAATKNMESRRDSNMFIARRVSE